jgi:hypothetical protein
MHVSSLLKDALNSGRLRPVQSANTGTIYRDTCSQLPSS